MIRLKNSCLTNHKMYVAHEVVGDAGGMVAFGGIVALC